MDIAQSFDDREVAYFAASSFQLTDGLNYYMVDPDLTLNAATKERIEKEIKERTRAMRIAGEDPYSGYSLTFHYSSIGRVVELSIDGSGPIDVDDGFVG